MRAVTLATGLALITTSLAIPCVTEMTYYNAKNRNDEEAKVIMCWDTETGSCSGDIAFLNPDRNANRVSICAHSGGKLEWHIGSGWSLFGLDLYSLDITVDVSTTDCTVNAYNTVFVKYVGLPLGVFRTDDTPASNSGTCPI